MLLSQMKLSNGAMKVIVREGTEAFVVEGVSSISELSTKSIKNGFTINEQLSRMDFSNPIDIESLFNQNSLTFPLESFVNQEFHVFGTAKIIKTPHIVEINILNDENSFYKLGYCLGYSDLTALKKDHATCYAFNATNVQLYWGPEIITGNSCENLSGILSLVRDGEKTIKKEIFLGDFLYENQQSPEILSHKKAKSGDIYIQILDPIPELSLFNYHPQKNDFYELDIPQFGIQLHDFGRKKSIKKSRVHS